MFLDEKLKEIQSFGWMMRKRMAWKEYERPEDFDEWPVNARLDDIVDRLQFITNQERYKFYRERFASDEQFQEQFGPESGHDKMLFVLWHSAKSDYSKNKEGYDTWLDNNKENLSENYLTNIEAMRRVIDDEIDAMLLEDLDDEEDQTESI